MKKSVTVAMLSAVLFATPVLAEEAAQPKEGHRGPHHGKMMEQIDTDKDGKVSHAEHLAFAEKKFNEMDANKDGFVTKEEGKAHWEAKKAEWKAKKASEEGAK
jgi:opacity protein-like surface antigen